MLNSQITPSGKAISKTERLPGSHPYRWVMLGLIWLLYFSFGLTMGCLAPLVTPMLKDLNMNSSQMGLINGSWQLIYVFVSPPAGSIVDRLGVRKSMGIGAGIMCLSMVARGASINFFTLILTVSIFGIGGPIISVGCPKVVSTWFSGRERGIAAGIYSTAPGTGLAVAFATASSIVLPLTDSWRGISIVYGAVILILVVAWWLFAKDPDALAGVGLTPSNETNESTRFVFTSLLKSRNVQLILLLSIGVFALQSSPYWAPAILEEKGMTLAEAGIWTSIATISSILAIVLIPSFVQLGFRVRTTAILFLAASIGALGISLLSDPWIIFSLILFNLGFQPLLPMTTLILMETPGVGLERMGTAAGLYFSIGELGGAFSPFIMGFMRDTSNSLNSAFLMLSALSFSLIVLLPLIKEIPTVKDSLKPDG